MKKKCAYGLGKIGYRQHLSIFQFTSIRLCLYLQVGSSGSATDGVFL